MNSIIIKNFYRKLRLLLLSIGSQKKCPICNFSFFSFLAAGSKGYPLKKYKVDGAGYRKNVICPSCGSSDRSRLLYLFLTNLKSTTLDQNIKLLHIAPDTEFPSFFKSRKNINYYNGDIDKNLADLEIDITKTNFENNFFDVIICNHVLEQIENDFIALQEIFRVLKRGGFAILQSPISRVLRETYENKSLRTPDDYLREYGQSDMRRIYGQDYQSRLESVGFKVNVYRPDSFLSYDLIKRYGISLHENIYIGSK